MTLPNEKAEYLARSADVSKNIPTQSYFDHVGTNSGVISTAVRIAEQTFSDPAIISAVRQASQLHDLGKLHKEIQDVLADPNGGKLPIRHERAGVTYLRGTNGLAALLVQSHHQSLPDLHGRSEVEKGIIGDIEWMDRDLDTGRLLTIHNDIFSNYPQWQYHNDSFLPSRKLSPLDIRMMLSCLVDADHGNSARHKGNETVFTEGKPKWKEWLERLISHVASIKKSGDTLTNERQRLRDLNFRMCLDADTNKGFRSCDAPVGSGKTFGCLAHALRVAEAHGMKKIITVLPLTTVIDQTVDSYKEAILRGSEKESSISAVHHAVEYNSMWARKYSALFNSPIIVTTSVNFFETLAGKTTGGLRKLHQYKDSVIVVDEAQISLHLSQWRFGWRWLKQLVEDYGCHVVLASGTQIPFWEHKRTSRSLGFVTEDVKVKPLFTETQNSELKSIEARRVTIIPSYRSISGFSELSEIVLAKRGPRVVIFNTVANAARFAHLIRFTSGVPVFHISNALTPLHRSNQIKEIKDLLLKKQDCIVSATSCIETGLDISFQHGFRQRSGLYQIRQLTGRVNRNFEYGENCEIEEFQIGGEDEMGRIFDNPHLHAEIGALERFLEDGHVMSDGNCASYLGYVLREMQQQTGDRSPQLLTYANLELRERNFAFEAVRTGFDVIETNQQTVIVNNNLVESLLKNDFIKPLDIVLNSIRIGMDRIEKLELPVRLVFPDGSANSFKDSLVCLDEQYYDQFYGYLLTFFERSHDGAMPVTARTT